MFRYTILLAAVFAAGCTTTPAAPGSTSPASLAIPSSASTSQPNAGHIVVRRDSGLMGSMCNHAVRLDGRLIATLSAGEEVTAYPSPGEHALEAATTGVWCSLSAVNGTSFTIDSGQSKSFRTGFTGFFNLIVAQVGESSTAGSQKAAASTPKVMAPTPVCVGQLECQRAWAQAQGVLETLTRMRLRIVTDMRIETFAPTGYGRMGGTVMKYPVSEDRYELRARFECYGSTGCKDLDLMALQLFNNEFASTSTTPSPSPQNVEVTQPQGLKAPGTTSQRALSVGKDSFVAEKVAREQQCNSPSGPKLATKGAGFELYTVECPSGDAITIRCEFGNCRVMK